MNMMKSKIITIAVAAIIIGAAVAVVFWPSENKGWHAWNPTVGEIDYSSISATPNIIGVIEEMYMIVYDEELPDPVVNAEMDFKSLVTLNEVEVEVENEDGEISMITSIITSVKSSGTGPGVQERSIEFTEDMINNMKIISYGKGFTDSYIEMLGESVWDRVVAAGNSTWNAYGDNTMLWEETLGSEFTINTLNLLSFLNVHLDSESTYCLVVWGYITNYDAVMSAISGFDNVELLCIDYSWTIGSIKNLLAVVDALGWLIGISTEENDALMDFYGRYAAIEQAVLSNPTNMTVYMEIAGARSPGGNTLTQLCFDVLGLENINTTSGINVFSDVEVVRSAPDIIFFDRNDPRTMEQKMRIVM